MRPTPETTQMWLLGSHTLQLSELWANMHTNSHWFFSVYGFLTSTVWNTKQSSVLNIGCITKNNLWSWESYWAFLCLSLPSYKTRVKISLFRRTPVGLESAWKESATQAGIEEGHYMEDHRRCWVRHPTPLWVFGIHSKREVLIKDDFARKRNTKSLWA